MPGTARVDQEEDPYNATKGFWHRHSVWFFTKKPDRTERYAPWLREDCLVMWQHRWYVPLLLSGLALPFLGGYFSNGWIGGVGCFMLAGAGRTFLGLNSTFCINSVCHLWGSQPYSRSNSSRDSWWVSLITLGEGTIIATTPSRGTIGTGPSGITSIRRNGSSTCYPSLDSPRGWSDVIRAAVPELGHVIQWPEIFPTLPGTALQLRILDRSSSAHDEPWIRIVGAG